MERSAMERKIISVTGKRQITIPLKFYEKLHFGKEVECFLANDAVVLRPLSNSDDHFTLYIRLSERKQPFDRLVNGNHIGKVSVPNITIE
jgi:bifunctional DNA-binding transcriptional regulator/antitoxin component of YhaV-PrlF toxin-antitoxin module